MKAKKKLYLTIEYERPEMQSNYIIIADILRQHADSICLDPNTGKTGKRTFTVKTMHGETKGSISWDMEHFDPS